MSKLTDKELVDVLDLHISSLERVKQNAIDVQDYEKAALARDDAMAFRQARNRLAKLEADNTRLTQALARIAVNARDGMSEVKRSKSGRQIVHNRMAFIANEIEKALNPPLVKKELEQK